MLRSPLTPSVQPMPLPPQFGKDLRPGWLPGDAFYGFNVNTGQALVDGRVIPYADEAGRTGRRNSKAWEISAAGEVIEFAVDVPRRVDDEDHIRPAAVGLSASPADPRNWSQNSATTTHVGPTEDGLYAMKVESAGATWHRSQATVNAPVTAGTRIYCAVLANEGTSGNIRIWLYSAGAEYSTFGTSFANLNGTADGSGTFGDYENVKALALPNGRTLLTFEFIPSISSGLWLGISANSNTVGEDVEILYANVTTGSQQIILDDTYTVAADTLTATQGLGPEKAGDPGFLLGPSASGYLLNETGADTGASSAAAGIVTNPAANTGQWIAYDGFVGDGEIRPGQTWRVTVEVSAYTSGDISGQIFDGVTTNTNDNLGVDGVGTFSGDVVVKSTFDPDAATHYLVVRHSGSASADMTVRSVSWKRVRPVQGWLGKIVPESLGSELVANGDFADPSLAFFSTTKPSGLLTRNTISPLDGVADLFFEAGGDNNSAAAFDVATEAGKVYQMSFVYAADTKDGGGVSAFRLVFDGVLDDQNYTATEKTSVIRRFVATDTLTTIQVREFTGPPYTSRGYFDNFSIREVISEHIPGSDRGPDILSDGTFDDPGSWTLDANNAGSVSGGICRVENGAATESYALKSVPLIEGRTYEITYDVVGNNATLGGWYLGGTRASLNAGVGTGHKQTIVAGTNDSTFRVLSNSATVGHWVEVDNVSIREVDPPQGMDAGGVILVDFSVDHLTSDTYRYVFQIDDGSFDNRVLLAAITTGNLQLGAAATGDAYSAVNAAGLVAPGTVHRAAIKFDGGEIAMSVDGAAVVRVTQTTEPWRWSRFLLGHTHNSQQFLLGELAGVTLIPGTKTDEELQALGAAA